MSDFLTKIGDWIVSTQVQAQMGDHDYSGLLTNPWFMVPFLGLLGYMMYKQNFQHMIVLAIFIGVWMFTGTAYMQELFATSGEGVALSKVLPVVFGGAIVLAVLVYMFFGRSD